MHSYFLPAGMAAIVAAVAASLAANVEARGKTNLIIWDINEKKIFEAEHRCDADEIRDFVLGTFENVEIDAFWQTCGRDGKTEVFLREPRRVVKFKPREPR